MMRLKNAIDVSFLLLFLLCCKIAQQVSWEVVDGITNWRWWCNMEQVWRWFDVLNISFLLTRFFLHSTHLGAVIFDKIAFKCKQFRRNVDSFRCMFDKLFDGIVLLHWYFFLYPESCWCLYRLIRGYYKFVFRSLSHWHCVNRTTFERLPTFLLF